MLSTCYKILPAPFRTTKIVCCVETTFNKFFSVAALGVSRVFERTGVLCKYSLDCEIVCNITLNCPQVLSCTSKTSLTRGVQSC